MRSNSVFAVEYSWEPFTASVDVADISPAATFWIRRSVPPPPIVTAPTDCPPAKLVNVVSSISVFLTRPNAPPVVFVEVTT